MPKCTCPSCGKLLNVGDQYAGKRAKCPGCQQAFTVPGASAEVVPVAPPAASPRRPPPPPAVTPAKDPEDEFQFEKAGRKPARGRSDDRDFDDDPGPRIRRRGEWADCPACGSSGATKVSWTWWGGFIGPMIINTVRCNRCGVAYNGVKGDYNTVRILLYMLIPLIIIIPLGCLGALAANMK